MSLIVNGPFFQAGREARIEREGREAYKDEGEDHLSDKERKGKLEFVVVEDRLVKERYCNRHNPVRCRHHQPIAPRERERAGVCVCVCQRSAHTYLTPPHTLLRRQPIP